ncbi:MAG: low molecular weight protein-tyrosine-phosphatase [Halioglobus sp.]
MKVLFVCLGNICRSPTAHGVFEHLVAQRGLGNRIEVDSCGTGDWHIGHAPDPRASAEASNRGYDLSHLRARQVVKEDFERFDYILAMDKQNLADLKAMQPQNYTGRLDLFMTFAADTDVKEVPDPYYGGDQGFAEVLDLIESASDGLLRDMGFEHTQQ